MALLNKRGPAENLVFMGRPGQRRTHGPRRR
jgi:hypothetical protein